MVAVSYVVVLDKNDTRIAGLRALTDESRAKIDLADRWFGVQKGDKLLACAAIKKDEGERTWVIEFYATQDFAGKRAALELSKTLFEENVRFAFVDWRKATLPRMARFIERFGFKPAGIVMEYK